MENRFKIEEYFTFEEGLANYMHFPIMSYTLFPYEEVSPNSTVFSALFVDYAVGWNLGTQVGQQFVLKSYLNELLTLVYARYLHHYCWNLDTAITRNDDNLTLAFKEFVVKLVNVIHLTYDKYKTLLDMYRNENLDLLKKVGAISNGIVKFNDTPQGSGDFSSDTHTTNITKSNTTNETDGATIMERINEIRGKYQNIMLDWTNEFDRLFVEEENI